MTLAMPPPRQQHARVSGQGPRDQFPGGDARFADGLAEPRTLVISSSCIRREASDRRIVANSSQGLDPHGKARVLSEFGVHHWSACHCPSAASASGLLGLHSTPTNPRYPSAGSSFSTRG